MVFEVEHHGDHGGAENDDERTGHSPDSLQQRESGHNSGSDGQRGRL